MSWQQYIEAANKRGFSDVAILDRGDGRVLAASGGLETKDVDRRAVNENQELLKRLSSAKTLTYGGVTYDVVLRDDEEGKWIVGTSKGAVITARQYKSLCVVTVGGDKFRSAPDAFKQVKIVWDALDEAGV